MSVQPQRHDLPGVAQVRQAERLFAARQEVEDRKLLDIFRFTCPVCFAQPGERCITRTGKRTAQHQARKADR